MNLVINLHGRRDDPDYDPALNDSVVYVGRRQWWGPGRQLDGHPLANNYSVKKYGRDVALNLYRNDVMGRLDLVEQLGKLRGKTLACWCVEPDRDVACHAQIIADLIDERWPTP